MDDKDTLTRSSAGIRLIALTTLFNRGDVVRMRDYIGDNYHAAALAEIPASTRLAELKTIYRLHGRLRIAQVIGADKHQVIAALASERGAHFLAQMTVEEDYPHRITAFRINPLA